MRKKTNLKLAAVRRGVKRQLQPTSSKLHASSIYPHYDADLPPLNFDVLADDGTYNDLLDASVAEDTIQRKNKKKQKTEDPDDLRSTFQASSSANVRFLLPTKGKDGLQMRYQEMEEIPEKKKEKAQEPREDPREPVKFPPFAGDPHWKRRIASLCLDVIENPEKNLKSLRELLAGLGEPGVEGNVIGVILASLVEVFKDILPGYRIHVAGEVEKEQRMKKETRELQSYEQALLGLYQRYLQKLEGLLGALKGKGAPVGAECGVAVKCLTQLLLTQMHFNFRKNLVSAVVTIATCRVPEFQETAAVCLETVFQQDKSGDASLDAVEAVSKLAKSGGQRLTRRLLETLTSIRLSKQLMEEAREKKAKPDRKTLSHAERKRQKEVAKVEKELQASQAQENVRVKARLQSQILQALFATYFRILRLADERTRRKLLPGVLMGVAKFAHLISIDFMDDLVETLHKIVQTEACSLLEGLLCVRTVLTLVSGQGTALNIDPHRFYHYLLQALAGLQGTEERAVFVQIVECVRKGFIERKKLISVERASRCAKGLASAALRSPPVECVALLLLLKSLLTAHPRLDTLLDPEFVQPALIIPTAADDVLAPAPLWELQMLRRHHHAAVRALTEKVLGHDRIANQWAGLLKTDPLEVLRDGAAFGLADVC